MKINAPAELTPQIVFDLTVEHLATQGGPARDVDRYYCMYRHPSGRECAVGAWIPDDKYDARIDQGGIIAGAAIVNLGLDHLRPFTKLLRSLQKAHDDCGTVGDEFDFGDMRVRLRAVARDHDLYSTAVKKHFP